MVGGIVMMEGDAGLWTSDTYSMQHLREALMHIPICGHSAPFLQWNGCDVSGFWQCTRQPSVYRCSSIV